MYATKIVANPYYIYLYQMHTYECKFRVENFVITTYVYLCSYDAAVGLTF